MSREEELVTSQPATGSDGIIMVTHPPFIPQPPSTSPSPLPGPAPPRRNEQVGSRRMLQGPILSVDVNVKIFELIESI